MANTTYFRTGKGSHRHASEFCANARRSIFTGEVQIIPADQVKDWAPCEICCEADDVAAATKTVQADAMCPNSGTKRPGSRRLYDDCRDCGKNGKVLANGTLRAHRPEK